MIQVNDLSFSYPGKPPSLSGVNFSLPQGSLLCLAGANGSGKSTLLALLAGLFVPNSGTITVGSHVSPGEAREISDTAALVLQEADLQILGSTVEEDLCLGLDRNDTQAQERARNLASRFGLDQIMELPVNSLSCGQRKKLCLAATLAASPTILLLDEPFAGLDYPAILEMRGILKANRDQNLTQVIATHDLEPVTDLSTHLAVLENGRLPLFGEPEQVLGRMAGHGVRPPCSWQAGLGILPWK